MNVEQLVKEKYFKKLKENDYIGVEIEIPIINNNQPFILDEKVIFGLFKELTKQDFKVVNYDNDNNIIAVRNNKNDDVISLEYSVNTIEISLSKAKTIFELQKKFNKYYEDISLYLNKYNYQLFPSGINKNYKYINKNSLNQNRYKIIERLLLNNNKNPKLLNQFCSYCSSVQTHVNSSVNDVVELLNMLTRIENIKTKAFANSYMDETNKDNSRMFLWKNSNFGPKNIGKNKIYKNLDDLLKDYCKRNLFFVNRNNNYLLLCKNQSLNEYFNKKKVMVIDDTGKKYYITPELEDFNNFRSYKSIELTPYGTLEIRTDCTPKLSNIFKLVAFNVGICKNYKEINTYIKYNKNITINKLIEFSILGLKKRGKKEEIILEDL